MARNSDAEHHTAVSCHVSPVTCHAVQRSERKLKHRDKYRGSNEFLPAENLQLLNWLLGIVPLDAFSTVRISRDWQASRPPAPLMRARNRPTGPFVCPSFSRAFALRPPFVLLPIALLLVCAACPVSVSVRPARPSVSEATRHSGHHSRFVQKSLLLATAAPVSASMSGVLLEPNHRVELFHPALAPVATRSRSFREPAGSGRWHGSRCAIRNSDGPASPSREVITCASDHKSLPAEAVSASSLQAGAG